MNSAVMLVSALLFLTWSGIVHRQVHCGQPLIERKPVNHYLALKSTLCLSRDDKTLYLKLLSPRIRRATEVLEVKKPNNNKNID